jgi:hypothetical protein
LESPCNGGINGYFTFEHGLLQGEPSTITSKWGCGTEKVGLLPKKRINTDSTAVDGVSQAIFIISAAEESSRVSRVATHTLDTHTAASSRPLRKASSQRHSGNLDGRKKQQRPSAIGEGSRDRADLA